MTSFPTNILNLYGVAGQRWLNQLPELSRYFAQIWQLGDLTFAKNLTYNAVYFSMQKPVVLKLGADRKSLAREVHALTVYQGQGGVRLIQSDLDKGALLIARAEPGISLKSLFPQDDMDAVSHAASVMKRLHAAPIPDRSLFPTLRDWFTVLNRDDSLPEMDFAKAKNLAQDLIQTSHECVLLHGDLHHENILLHEGDWVAIDPKGVLGDPAYEVGAFMSNPSPDLLDQPNLPDLLRRRLTLFARLLNQDPQRLCQWSYIQSMVTAGWMREDNSNPEGPLTVAKCLEKIIDE